MKRQSLFLAMGLLMLLSIFQVPQITNSVQVEPNALTSGTIDGISYSYGQEEFTASGNITRTLNNTVIETLNRTRMRTATIPLVTGYNISDVFYNLVGIEETATQNLTINDWYNNASLWLYIDIVINQMPLAFDPLNATHGAELEDLQVISDYRVIMTNAISRGGEFLGQFPVNTTYISYNHKYFNGTVTRKTFEIQPLYYLIKLQTVMTEVNIKQMEFGFGAIGSWVRHSVEYNISASAYKVNITDGENFGMGVTMFDEINATYTESIISVFAFSFININYYNLTFAGNGSYVDGAMYPFSLRPVISSTSGTVVEAGYRSVTSKIRSTFQSVVAGFVSKSMNDTDPANVSASARLAVWGIQFGNVLVAYDEGNDNDRLDLALGDSGLEVQNDQVKYLGLGEAYSTTVQNAYFSQVTLEQNISAPFNGFSASTSINNTEFFYNSETYGIGDMSSSSTNQFYWNDPVSNTDGTVEFDFGIQYNNFPITWYNTTDGTSDIDYENLKYGYRVTVDPATGRASMKTSWEYGGITDSTLKSAMSGLSLAMMVKSEFFSLQAFYSATATNETVNATRSRAISGLKVDTGVGEPASEINVTGPLQFYNSSGANYTASFDAINVVQVSGGFAGERVSPFSSESETGGDATSGALVERLGVSFFYSLDLIVVSFPTWGGNDIIWDPEFGVSYQSSPTQTTSTSDTTSDTSSTPTTSDTSSTPTTSDTGTTSTTSDTGTTSTSDEPTTTTQAPTEAPSPGFEFWMVAIALSSVIFFKKKKK